MTGAFLVAFNERRSHEELAKQYERMESVFRTGAGELDEHLGTAEASGRPEAERALALAQDVLVALGREAITEHSQWLILRRSRPLELLIH